MAHSEILMMLMTFCPTDEDFQRCFMTERLLQHQRTSRRRKEEEELIFSNVKAAFADSFLCFGFKKKKVNCGVI